MPERQSTPVVSSTLPQDLVQSLEHARFLHLATSSPDAMPHISLMNYTYLPSSPYSSSPQIIMTTPPTSQKTHNLLQNPRVSLLVHDWVSARPPTLSSGREASPPPAASRSSLATLLLGMNTAALSRISATINGDASFVEQGSEEEKWLKAQHLANNTFGSEMEGGEDGVLGSNPAEMGSGDGGRGCWVEGEEVRVVVVSVKGARIADWKGGVTDWAISDETNGRPLTNGV